MVLNLGTTNINKTYLGNTEIKKAYLGTNNVFKIEDGTLLYGGESLLNYNKTYYLSCTQISEDKAYVTYKDVEAGVGEGRIITVSGTSISYGAVSTVYSGDDYYKPSVTLIDTDKIFITYLKSSDNYTLHGVIGTVSGTNVSYGTHLELFTNTASHISVCKLDTNKVIIACSMFANGYASVCTVSGTTITKTEFVAFRSNNTVEYNDTIQLDTDKVLITYSLNEGQGIGSANAIIATASGTTLSFGNNRILSSKVPSYTSVGILDTNKVFIAYRESDNYYPGYGVVATISGTSISIGSRIQFDTEVEYISVTGVNTNKVFIAYKRDGDGGYGIGAIIDGTTITYGDKSLFKTTVDGGTNYITSCKFSDNKVFIGYQYDNADFRLDGYGIAGTVN